MTTNDIDAIRKLADAATEGPWFYNSYSGVFSAPKVQPYEEWLNTIGEHSLERHGSCSACNPDASTGCQLFSEDYKRDSVVAHMPAHHGDTAVGMRAADAGFVAAARTLVPALCDEVEQLRPFETAVLHMLALAGDEYRQTIVAARAAGSSGDYDKNNGRAESIRLFATGLAERAGLPVIDWEQIKRDVPADGVYRTEVKA